MFPFNSEQLKPGDTIWQYQIDKFLGKGSFGFVYLAHHITMTRRLVAIKQLKMSEANPSVIKRFIHESYAMGELFHPNVVLVFELIEPDKYPGVESYYIVMEYIDGGTLRDWMDRRQPPLTLPDSLRIIKEICIGLAVAHQENIFHRDIKPENILLSADGAHVKIGDWGLAHLEEHAMTQMGDIMGTLNYMPPEQASGLSAVVDGRADLYSVGVMLYEMITGHMPLDFHRAADQALERALGKNPMVFADKRLQQQIARDAMYQAAENAPRIDPATFSPNIPRPLRDLLLKAVSIRPDDRFQNAQEFVTAIDGLSARVSTPQPSSTATDERFSKVASLLLQARQKRQERGYTEALQLLGEARKILPHDPGVCLELARIHNLMGKRDEALAVLKDAAAEANDNYVLMRDLGITLMGLKEKEQALQALEQSLALNPNQSQVQKLIRRLKT